MFHRVQEYPLIYSEDGPYRPRAYGQPQGDETWGGWIVFFPLRGGAALATERETTQHNLAAVTAWAAALTPVYLEGAFDRALRLAAEPLILAQLDAAEYTALEDAARLEAAAEVERETAAIDDAAAVAARADAERLRRERLATESALAAAEAAAAKADADVHERAAREARAVAADAGRRSRKAGSAAVRSRKPRR